MPRVHNLHKTFGVDVVLSDVDFTLNDGEHVGLIGPNGVGKSTLLRCIVGQDRPDSGATVGDALSTARSDLAAADADLRQATDALARSPDSTEALAAYGAALTRFESLGGYAREHFEAALDAFSGTVVAVSHDRAFLRHIAQRIIEIRDGQARPVPTNSKLEAAYGSVKPLQRTEDFGEIIPEAWDR